MLKSHQMRKGVKRDKETSWKKISRGKSLSKIFASKEEALNVIEKAILFFRDNGLKGERFAETIERIGFENVEKALLQD